MPGRSFSAISQTGSLLSLAARAELGRAQGHRIAADMPDLLQPLADAPVELGQALVAQRHESLDIDQMQPDRSLARRLPALDDIGGELCLPAVGEERAARHLLGRLDHQEAAVAAGL